ncbi:MAG: hypothetical protein EBS61_08655 [Betaproteobacteria bacterium]|nr:hypothetical protein [Betaproteobacteria bacterium]
MIPIAEYRTHHLRSASGGIIAELVIVAAVLVVGFAYVDVPLNNALLIGIAITLQAAFGTLLLTRILSGLKGSVLLLLGPGVIVGGSLSFALFQGVGRGWFGAVLVTATGLLSSFRLVRSTPWQLQKTERLWLITQILGLSAFALTWEFGELLPVAIACFAFGIFAGQSPRLPKLVEKLVGVVAVGVIFVTFLARKDYWWLVSDDYLFFEAMSRHITKAGVLADWGVFDLSRYHWFAYGWSGLLNFLGGNPEPFVTLTRVMPAVYSLALGASLMLICEKFAGAAKMHHLSILPAWTIVALHRMDWSGTSTSGVYSALAALATTIALELSTTNSLRKRLVLYTLWLPIITLTKLPASFAILVAFSLLEVWISAPNLRCGKRLLLLVPAPFIIAFIAVTTISLAGGILGRWSFVSVNSGLGQLAQFGPVFAGLGLVLQKLWIWIPICVGLLWVKQNSLPPTKQLARGLLYCTVPLFSLAIFLDVKVSANANNTEYFSGPMYFLSSAALLMLAPAPNMMLARTRLSIGFMICVVTLFAVGYLWERLEFAVRLWKFIGTQVPEWDGLNVALPQWVSADGRVAITVALVTMTLAGRRNGKWQLTAILAALFALTAFTLYSYVDHARGELSRNRSVDEIESNIGATEIQSVGHWLARNSQSTAKIATNHLVDSNGGELADYSLAVWSNRTYLVLGPRFVPDSPAKKLAVDLSLRFAENPTKTLCRSLAEQGVDWFVVDQRLTKTQSWQVCATTAFESANLKVLRLKP